MFVELHIIQNFAPSCLNRDDTNTPKDCEFGGHRRARVSSQCIKRAIRWHPVFKEKLGQEPSLRTRRARRELAGRLIRRGFPRRQVEAASEAFVPAALVPLAGGQTKVMLFLGHDELQKMEDQLSANWDRLEPAATALIQANGGACQARETLEAICSQVARSVTPGTKAADIALFGRMIAEKQKDEVNAACQVAHAISTHKVTMDVDFYTAVDDLQSCADEPGAGMMGSIEFNSSCFYRYSLVDTNQLLENLAYDRDLARRATEAFIHASIAAVPTGKQNSFAAHNPPALILITVRDSGVARSLVNAFESPVRVRPSDEWSLSDKSIRRLDTYWGALEYVYGRDSAIFKKALTFGVRNVRLRHIPSAATLYDLARGAMEAIRL